MWNEEENKRRSGVWGAGRRGAGCAQGASPPSLWHSVLQTTTLTWTPDVVPSPGGLIHPPLSQLH